MKCGLLTGLKFNRKILLTGAGFTRDFGGFLANEMWRFTFNSPALNDHPEVKDLLREDFSYESVYHKIIEGEDYTNDAKKAIKEVVQSAYDRLDENIRGNMQRIISGTAKANATSLTAFINEFCGGSNEIGLFFTLNQDIFVERYCRYQGRIPTPGILLQDINYTNVLTKSAIQQLPDKEQLSANDFKKSLRSFPLQYIKLHGSYHWRDSKGNTYMVIGKNKEEDMSKEPLLTYYLNLFKEVLLYGGTELFVIGYGFVDGHINKIIYESLENHRLKLYIMNLEAPEKFKEDLQNEENKPHCKTLWNRISGYYPYSVSTVFPPDNGAISTAIEYKQIMKDFFNRVI